MDVEGDERRLLRLTKAMSKGSSSVVIICNFQLFRHADNESLDVVAYGGRGKGEAYESMAVLSTCSFYVWFDECCCLHHASSCRDMQRHADDLHCICIYRSGVLLFQLKTGIFSSRASTRFVSLPSYPPSSPSQSGWLTRVALYIYIPVDTRSVQTSLMAEVDIHSLQPAA